MQSIHRMGYCVDEMEPRLPAVNMESSSSAAVNCLYCSQIAMRSALGYGAVEMTTSAAAE